MSPGKQCFQRKVTVHSAGSQNQSCALALIDARIYMLTFPFILPSKSSLPSFLIPENRIRNTQSSRL